VSRETLAHLAGYSTLALILGTASWSTFGWVFALPLVFGTLAILGYRGFHAVVEKARVDGPDIEPAEPGPEAKTAATDGGRPISSLTADDLADAVEDHGAENVCDDAIVAALRGEA
jgi:hypothetical protein